MINPEAIPQFTGNLPQLETDCGSLKTDAGNIRESGADVHSHFQGLSAYYKAPEAEQLFASTKPVKDRADGFADDLEKVSSALSDYATEVRPLADKLEQLKADATKFVSENSGDDDWEYDEDKVDEHNDLRNEITATVAAFWAAERTCHNKITTLWGGTQMVAGDGSDRKDQYGFNADDMKNAKVPWGDPVEEKHHWYEVGHWVKSFVWDGVIVDGVWGTIKGLGTLVGFGGWDAAGKAWKGLAQLGTGLALSSLPGIGTAFWALPDDKLPSWLRDSRTSMKETGKALIAWDEWGKNPGRAAGAVTFNVVTTVLTGGAGGAASGVGKAGAVAKVLSVAGKAGKVIDPMTYVAKGAGAGLSKIGDITKGLRGVGNVEVPKLPDDVITLPEGTVKLPDGAVRLPEGAAIPDGAVKLPEGTVKLPDNVPALPEGTVKLPTGEGVPAQYLDPNGNILDHQGNTIRHTDLAPSDVVGKHADPHVETPAKEPSLAGAGHPGHGHAAAHDPPTGGHGDSPGSAGHDGPAGGDHTPGGAGDGHGGAPPGHGYPPHDGGGKRPGLTRQDDNFASEHNSRGQRKSHLNANGDLVPANPDGNASVVDHIVGRDPAKSDSPFTSLSAEGANAKAFGSSRIRIDLDRLEADSASGKLQGVEVYSPERVQNAIQAYADNIAGKPVDLTVPPGTTKAEAEEHALSLGLSKSKAKRVAQRMIDMMNTRRDEEWLIKGVVPHKYIEGPFDGQ